jgi:hypothetical protein
MANTDTVEFNPLGRDINQSPGLRAVNRQNLPGTRIHLEKLSVRLKMKFGIGSYEIHLMHDVYSIVAPGCLTTVR